MASKLIFLSLLSLFAASTEALERQCRSSSVLGELSTCSEALPAVERKRVKPEPNVNFQNWLSGDAANNMFKTKQISVLISDVIMRSTVLA